MIILWITLLLLHQGYALISVTTVPLGESVTFTCFFPDSEYSNTRVKWYKQSIGNSLLLMTTLMKATSNPTFEQGFPSSRFDANYTIIMSTLTILRTIREDEAVYHCAVSTWSKDKWNGTYLSLKENTHRTAKYTVVQSSTESNPVHPGDSVTLQCSVLSDSEHKTCPGRYNVHWYRARLDGSHPDIIYTDGNSHDPCDKRPDAYSSPKSCVYRFSKNVNKSDAGTYYCALATCGEIIFGNGTKLDIEGTSIWSFGDLKRADVILPLLCAVLAICVIVIACLIYAINKNKCDHCNAAVSLHKSQKNMQRDEDSWMYSAAVFTMMKPRSGGVRDAKALEKERLYAAVKAFGLD
ncbi:uncharacterized protein [Thunnus thynnus]|uniref:uncharacterized protein n=1 Tax=Thunnus thynnus TaxID=8237 RepID=UPI003528A43A